VSGVGTYARREVTVTRLLDFFQAADALGCSRTHIYDLVAAGELTPVNISAVRGGSKTRIDAADIDAFIERRKRSVPKSAA
jgi:excisionase family DNA binding protein